jgi:hypothetical protein
MFRAETSLSMAEQTLPYTVEKRLVNVQIECNWVRMEPGSGVMSVGTNTGWHEACILTR